MVPAYCLLVHGSLIELSPSDESSILDWLRTHFWELWILVVYGWFLRPREHGPVPTCPTEVCARLWVSSGFAPHLFPQKRKKRKIVHHTLIVSACFESLEYLNSSFVFFTFPCKPVSQLYIPEMLPPFHLSLIAFKWIFSSLLHCCKFEDVMLSNSIVFDSSVSRSHRFYNSLIPPSYSSCLHVSLDCSLALLSMYL